MLGEFILAESAIVYFFTTLYTVFSYILYLINEDNFKFAKYLYKSQFFIVYISIIFILILIFVIKHHIHEYGTYINYYLKKNAENKILIRNFKLKKILKYV